VKKLSKPLLFLMLGLALAASASVKLPSKFECWYNYQVSQEWNAMWNHDNGIVEEVYVCTRRVK